ncbi:MAG: gliding motility-associated C-terminal domain-containing protein [Bacteroidetes bacterium]|nr:gliding motility-associated C-terminal domain-containing protein [Bacteroidota bacterium]
MRKVAVIALLLLCPLVARSSHIVGGEFELIHLSGYQYRLNLILYFDKINGSPGAFDPLIQARIFRKMDNSIMQNITLPFSDSTKVSYTQPECSHGEIKTEKLRYTVLITLSPEVYNDPSGYYVVWERCCRNYNTAGLINIISEAPPLNSVNFSNYAGQTFYLEFPPVVKGGDPFVDSTPQLFPPLNDYACPGKPYYADFSGTDADNDSLVYSLAVPLNTHTAEALPPINPAPYPLVKWRSPFSFANIIGGNPDLSISKDGLLRVTPGFQGLFVFAVKVEEYRNKIKIGETRRDFQMLVVDACPNAVPPQIVGKKLNDASYTYENTMDVVFPSLMPDDQRCIKVRVTDDDSRADRDGSERVRIKAVALNFKKDLSSILPAETTATLINGSSVEFTICFPECPYFIGGDPQIGIVAMDDACALPLTDTLKVNVHVEPPPNSKPYFTSSNPVTSVLTEGQQAAWPWAAKDDDGDPLIVSLLTDGFVLQNAGMTFTTANQVAGAADGQLSWDAFCNIYDFTKRTNFQVRIMVEDQDKCLLPGPAVAQYNLSVILPAVADPVIDTDLTSDPAERRVEVSRRIFETLKFNILGTNINPNDLLKLKGAGTDFAIATTSATISPLPATGTGAVSSSFLWNLQCANMDLKKKDLYDFRFIVVDSLNKCHFYKTDTVDVVLKVLPPVNHTPILTIVDQVSSARLSGLASLTNTLGIPVQLQITGTDEDLSPKDSLWIELLKPTGSVDPDGYSFKPVKGVSPITTAFQWAPDCSIFQNDIYENDYSFTFRIRDNRCFSVKRDSVVLSLKIKDVDGSDTNFQPPNFFSPNGDNINDYFAMEAKDPVTGETKNILPLDNCVSKFESVNIYNRWGGSVFSSTERDFKWFGQNESPGVYYYSIRFTKKEYRGSLSLRY